MYHNNQKRAYKIYSSPILLLRRDDMITLYVSYVIHICVNVGFSAQVYNLGGQERIQDFKKEWRGERGLEACAQVFLYI